MFCVLQTVKKCVSPLLICTGWVKSYCNNKAYFWPTL